MNLPCARHPLAHSLVLVTHRLVNGVSASACGLQIAAEVERQAAAEAARLEEAARAAEAEAARYESKQRQLQQKLVEAAEEQAQMQQQKQELAVSGL